MATKYALLGNDRCTSAFNFNGLHRTLAETFVTILTIVFFGIDWLQTIHGIHYPVDFNIRTFNTLVNAEMTGKIHLVSNFILFQKTLDVLQVCFFGFWKAWTSQANPDLMNFCFRFGFLLDGLMVALSIHCLWDLMIHTDHLLLFD